jgi:hypothetical protein
MKNGKDKYCTYIKCKLHHQTINGCVHTKRKNKSIIIAVQMWFIFNLKKMYYYILLPSLRRRSLPLFLSVIRIFLSHISRGIFLLLDIGVPLLLFFFFLLYYVLLSLSWPSWSQNTHSTSSIRHSATYSLHSMRPTSFRHISS